MTHEPIATLIERSGPSSGRRHSLYAGTWTIGRTSDADLVLDHADVSREHARLHLDDHQAEIEDLGSKNGIRIAGRRVEREPLEHGVELEFGELVVAFEHHGIRIDRLLVEHGELTATRPRLASPAPPPSRPSLFVPLLAAGVFALLLAALLLYG